MTRMGRQRSTHPGLPPKMHFSKGFYWFVTTTKPRRWISLGKDKAAALTKWAGLAAETTEPLSPTLQHAWARYAREVMPEKASATQRDNKRESALLLAVFGKIELTDIEPLHVRQYLDLRGKTSKVRATREKALLSHIFNKAREWGMTAAPNPCAGVKGFKTPRRKRYVSDAELLAVWEAADVATRDALDLALLTGQRPADVLKMRRTDIRGGSLWVRQNKTGTMLRINIVGMLESVIKRCNDRAATHSVSSLHLVQTEKGQPMAYRTLNVRFLKAIKAAGVEPFQFRDIRGKTATDLENLEHAQRLLGHGGRAMTESYIKARSGQKVEPLR